MKYAGIYTLRSTDLATPRRAGAATRLAAYNGRRAARQDGRQPVGDLTVSVATGALDPDEAAVRVEFQTVPL